LPGYWDAWTNKKTKDTLKTFSTITTQANPPLAVIHNAKRRMPVILRPEDERRWLSDIPMDEIMDLLAPYDEKAMEAHTVTKLITTRGRPTNVAEVMSPFRYEDANLASTPIALAIYPKSPSPWLVCPWHLS
jgi:putative SOS response-associated peptidase YedK